MQEALFAMGLIVLLIAVVLLTHRPQVNNKPLHLKEMLAILKNNCTTVSITLQVTDPLYKNLEDYCSTLDGLNYLAPARRSIGAYRGAESESENTGEVFIVCSSVKNMLMVKDKLEAIDKYYREIIE